MVGINNLLLLRVQSAAVVKLNIALLANLLEEKKEVQPDQYLHPSLHHRYSHCKLKMGQFNLFYNFQSEYYFKIVYKYVLFCTLRF